MSFSDFNVNEYWNPATNRPKLVSGQGTHGKGYFVSVPGSTVLDGNPLWAVGDIAIFILDKWVRLTGVGILLSGKPESVDSRTLAIQTSFAPVVEGGPKLVETLSYDVPGDQGGALYHRVDVFPAQNVGTFTSADGQKWSMIPNGITVSSASFGTKSNAVYNDRFPDNSPAFNNCLIWMYVNGVTTMSIPNGIYYTSKPISIEAGNVTIQGAGQGVTWIRPEWNADGFIIQHSYGGESGNTFGHEGSGYGGFPTTNSVGMEFSFDTSNRIYVCRVGGPANLNSVGVPTGTGTGIVCADGSVWDYVRDRTFMEKTGVGGSQSVIRDLTVWGMWDRDNPTEDDTDITKPGGGLHCGILMRSRGTAERIYSLSNSGHGIAMIADGDLELRGGGNCNGWQVNKVRCYYNGYDGLHAGFGDANAGVGIDIDVSTNGRWGVADWSFLGNRWLNLQSAYDGFVGLGVARKYGLVVHDGYIWLANVQRSHDLSPYSAIEPGGAGSSWAKFGGNGSVGPQGNAPVWKSTDVYQATGCFSSADIDCKTQWYGPYIEGGTNPAQFNGNDSVFGGQMGSWYRGGMVFESAGTGGFTNLGANGNYASADNVYLSSIKLGPQSRDSSLGQQADSTFFNFQTYEGQVILGQTDPLAQTITGSIAQEANPPVLYRGRISQDGYDNIMVVVSGTIPGTGWTLSGAGIPAGTVLGTTTGLGSNSFFVNTPDGSVLHILEEDMSSQGPALSYLTVTVPPANGDTLSPGAFISGTGIKTYTQLSTQVDPVTHAGVNWVGLTGKYLISRQGMTIASEVMTVRPDGVHNLDFALGYNDLPNKVFGWSGRNTKLKFGRPNIAPNVFWADSIALGAGGGVLAGSAVIIRASPGGPNPVDNLKTGEIRFNSNLTGAGQAWGWVFLGTDTGMAGTPRWMPLGVVS